VNTITRKIQTKKKVSLTEKFALHIKRILKSSKSMENFSTAAQFNNFHYYFLKIIFYFTFHGNSIILAHIAL
jgi:hypothetical protein